MPALCRRFYLKLKPSTMSNPMSSKPAMQIHLANPRGFCAGVDRAINIVERALELFGAPVYVRHEVVHNKFVVEGLRAKGVVFVEELHEVPDDNIVIFSAHGVSKAVREGILIGHAGHPEVEGTMGQWEKTAGGGEMYLVQDVNEAQALAVRDPD